MPYSIWNNSRFYVLAFSVILSLCVTGFLRNTIVSDQLFAIRLQQIFGSVAIVFVYIALLVGPLATIFGKSKLSLALHSRRALGISAFLFTIAHGMVAVYMQFGGLGQLLLLPTFFKWSLVAGSLGSIILLLLALTSFDAVIKKFGFKKWKRLHQLIYIAYPAIIIHIWMIGTHIANDAVQIGLFASILILVALESVRIVKKIPVLDTQSKSLVAGSIVFGLAVLLVSVPYVLNNYHDRHQDHTANEIRQ